MTQINLTILCKRLRQKIRDLMIRTSGYKEDLKESEEIARKIVNLIK